MHCPSASSFTCIEPQLCGTTCGYHYSSASKCACVAVGQTVGQWLLHCCVLRRSGPSRVGDGSSQFQQPHVALWGACSSAQGISAVDVTFLPSLYYLPASCVIGHFPLGFASSSWFLSQPVLEESLLVSGIDFIQARCPSCHPSSRVKALKETQSTDPNQWHSFILSLFTAWLVTEGALPTLYQLSITSTLL